MMEGQGKLFLLPLAACRWLYLVWVSVFSAQGGIWCQCQCHYHTGHRKQSWSSWPSRVTFTPDSHWSGGRDVPPPGQGCGHGAQGGTHPRKAAPGRQGHHPAQGEDDWLIWIENYLIIPFSHQPDWFLPALYSLQLSLLKWGGRPSMSSITPPPPPPQCPPPPGRLPRPRTRWRSATGTSAYPWRSSRRWRTPTISRKLW